MCGVCEQWCLFFNLLASEYGKGKGDTPWRRYVHGRIGRVDDGYILVPCPQLVDVEAAVERETKVVSEDSPRP